MLTYERPSQFWLKIKGVGLRVREFILVYNPILLLYRMSTGLSSLATAASGCKFYWSHLRKVLDWSDTPGAVTETKYLLISSFTFLLYDHGKIGISSPNHLLISSTLYLTAITFDAEVRSHVTKLGILFWSVFMLGHECLGPFMVAWKDPLLMGQSTLSRN